MIDAELLGQIPQAEPRPPIPGFSGWWDAADPGAIQGGIGDTVREWRDKSGAGRHASQGTDSARPFTGSWSRNGRNVIWTTGRAAVLVSSIPLTAFPWAVFMAAGNTASDAVQRTIMSGFYGSGIEWGRVYRPTSNAIALYAGAVLASPRLWERDRPRIVCGIFNGASSSVRVDGRYVTAGNSGVTSANSVQQSMFGLGLSESWFGWIGELIVYDARTLTPSEIERIESYLARKWGIA